MPLECRTPEGMLKVVKDRGIKMIDVRITDLPGARALIHIKALGRAPML